MKARFLSKLVIDVGGHMDFAAILETVRKDTAYALRTMCQKPVFSATAIFTLALGIGGSTAMFTVVRGVLLRPLEYRDPDRLVRLSAEYTRLNSQNTPFSLRRFLELKDAGRSFNGAGAYLHTPENVTLSGAGEPETVMEARVSADFLAILGVPPLVGRSFPGSGRYAWRAISRDDQRRSVETALW
jgi:hypothetical protein